MIACPVCGGLTRVTETRPVGDGNRRRRRCIKLECSGRVTTAEVVVAGRYPGSRSGGAAALADDDAVLVSRAALARLRRVVAALGGAL